jgi:hypothetical protein
MNRFPLSVLCCVLLAFSGASAQDTAAVWAEKNKDALAAITDAALADLLTSGDGLANLLAEVKTGYASDPAALIRIAALSQYVMRPAGTAARAAYADALLAAAARAAEADVACVFLDQLRWCGLPRQADALKAFAASDKPGVAALAAMTVQAVTGDRASKAAPAAPTRYATLAAELAAVPPDALTPRLLQAFDDADVAFAGTALSFARTAGGTRDTPLWAAKLAATADPVRKIMLLDLLGERGDSAAQGAVAACLAHADDPVAAAAHRAFLRLGAPAYAAHIPTVLSGLPPSRLALVRDSLRQLDTPLVRVALLHAYPAFSAAGKLTALELFKERRVVEAAPLALAALDDANEETAIAGFRLLREVAGKEQADTLVAKTLASAGRVTPEAQTTLAAAARRDVSGAYAASLVKAIATAPDAQKPVALETAARFGGAPLLAAVEAAAAATAPETATAAVRALAAWPDAAALPALVRIARDTPDAKHRALAQRGIDRLKVETNVALNKAVTSDTPTEGDNVPANLVDGTIEKQWHAHGIPASATVDLAGDYPIDAMHVTFYHADGRAYTFKLELSADSKTWKEVASNISDVQPATAAGLRLTFPPTPARYARLTVLKNTANPFTHVAELKLFSTAQP